MCRLQVYGEDGGRDVLRGAEVSELVRRKALRLQKDEAQIPQVSCQTIFMEDNFIVCCSAEQVNNLREVQALRRLNPHTNVIDLKEVIL